MIGKARYSTFETRQLTEVNSERGTKSSRNCCSLCWVCCCCETVGSTESIDVDTAVTLVRQEWARRRDGPLEYTDADAAAGRALQNPKSANFSLNGRAEPSQGSSSGDKIIRAKNCDKSSSTEGETPTKILSEEETSFTVTPKQTRQKQSPNRCLSLEETFEKLKGFRTKTPVTLRKNETGAENQSGNKNVSASSTGTESSDEVLRGAKRKNNIIKFRNGPDINIVSYGNLTSCRHSH